MSLLVHEWAMLSPPPQEYTAGKFSKILFRE